jgi:hypothetical protein
MSFIFSGSENANFADMESSKVGNAEAEGIETPKKKIIDRNEVVFDLFMVSIFE